jgi:osmotically-inducible protein OsmY
MKGTTMKVEGATEVEGTTGVEKEAEETGGEATKNGVRNEGVIASETRSSRTNRTRGESIMVKRHRMLSLLICIGLIAAFVGCASTSKREGTGEYLDDSAITTKVKAAIFNDPTLKVFQINVETFKGDVQLSGFVDSAESVKKAGEVARGIAGVKSVKNSLIVK